MQLYKDDNQLPAMRVLLDTSIVAARIWDWIGGPEFSLSIANIRYKPGTSCVVSYELRTATDVTYLHAKAFQKRDWPIRMQKLVGDPTRVFWDDALAFALFRLPNDSEIPAIHSFFDDPGEFLSRILFRNSSQEVYAGFETLAYKPNRRLTLRVKCESGKSFVLKFHDESTFQRALKSADFLKRSILVETPVRIGRSKRYRSLAYEWVSGLELDFATVSMRECNSTMEMVFNYLDRLHVSLEQNNVRSNAKTSTTGIEAMKNYLAEIYPPVEAVANRIANAILLNVTNDFSPSFVHGDFHERQIIQTEDGLKACDFDNCGLADSTSDLANFVAHLHYRSCLDEVPSALAKQIEDVSLVRMGRGFDQSAPARYGWNRIAALFRLASHPFRSGHSDWTERTERLLRQLESEVCALPSVSTSRFDSPRGSAVDFEENGFPTANRTTHPCKVSGGIRQDPKFHFLQDAFELSIVNRALTESVPEIEAAYGKYDVVNIFLRRYKSGRRCLIEYELATNLGPRSILGKVSAKRLDRSTFETQSSLHGQFEFAAGNDDGIFVPKPIGSHKPWKMWFQEKAIAEPGIAFLKQNKLSSVTKRIALSLAKLHTCGLTPVRVHSIADELGILTRRLSLAIAQLPRELSRVEKVLENCHLVGRTIGETHCVPVHRDFYHDQIMFSDTETYLVDLDLVAFGHPALDVGNFLAHLTEHGIRRFDDPQHWLQEEHEIADHYVSVCPSVTFHEIKIFKALALARHIYISWSKGNRQDSTPGIIDETETLLASLIPAKTSY